ncbi:putative Zn-dependent protease [Altererythrobacter atlanticus]|uniref:TPR repeat-containing protein YfgC n=1 Tax=Croceibacterium atlanticum TaxID=1267766 RepID=A0A0F7KVK4_9SPHN|nr:M48 family metalloprotease [Croceibacterium atlanticum]AKH43267.1 TPR repeat-containing protein YfgC precursor [Croceibacterium atlanticum]MBB5732027.1 putative Zn-dependent protease [Croceibacterium atlanticum]
MAKLYRPFSSLFAFLAMLILAAQPAAAQSVLRDAETEALLQEMVDPLAEAAGLQKGAVEVVLLNDPSINAFVAGGQRIYVHSGLINAADTANEVQGVLAHELGHIVGGHIIRYSEGAGKATKITVLSMLVGLAATLAGAGEAGMGAMALGQQAAMGSFLQFTRTQEASADAAGADFLSTAGITGKGSIEFFKKLQNQEFRYGYSQSDEAGFARTHPLTGDRISRLEGQYRQDPAWNKEPDADQQRRFEAIKAKLYGYLATPAQTLNSYPEYMTSTPARYARAYAYHKEARMDEALAETEALIAQDPDNPYFLELEGQVLLESGKPEEALPSLRRATQLTGNSPLIASTFGHALIATENPEHYAEAERVLKAAVARDREMPFAWYQLGVVYAANGDLPRARLASAEQQVMTGKPREALRSAEAAQRGLPEGSSDWIRAQDVALQARAQLEREEERH